MRLTAFTSSLKNFYPPPAVVPPPLPTWRQGQIPMTWRAVGINTAIDVDNPGNPNSNGVFGRFFNSSRLKGVGVHTQPDQPVWFFALE